MSSEKTPNLQLHKWQATDYVQRTEFNDNFVKIDQHAKQVTEQLEHTNTEVKSVRNRETALRPMITIIVDDGRIQDYTILKRFTEEYGIPFTSALISSRVGASNGEYMGLSHINELQSLGWEFIAHTHAHQHLSELATEEEIEAEISLCVDWLNEHGFNSDYLVYPFSSHDNRVMKIAAKYHKASFTGRGINFSPTKPSQALPRVVFGGTDNLPGQDTLEFYLSQVDEAIAGNGWLVFVIHSAYPSFDETQQGYLEEVIEYAQSKNVEFVHVAEAYPIFKNVVETIDYLGGNEYNYTALGANGDIYTNKMLSTTHQAAQISRTRKITASMRIDEIPNLPKGSRIYEMIHSVDNHGFPVTSGRLEIFRAPSTSDESFSYQLLTGNDGVSYFRYWQSTNDKWSNFKTFDQNKSVYIKTQNELTGLELPSAFSSGITMGELTTSQASTGGLPLGVAGLLITEKAGNNTYVEQTYKHINSNRVYVRGSNGAGDGWTAWQEVIKVEFLTSDSVTASTNPSTFPTGITYCEISAVFSATNGFPTGLEGLLITEKTSTSNYGQIKQTFKLHRSNRQFVRSGNFSTSWTAWYEINMTAYTS